MNMVLTAAMIVVPMIFAIVFHEVAHGLVASWLGDPTASERRRLSLNPLRHVDLFGTIILPGLLFLVHAPVFGWAKPVPIDYRRLHQPKRDMALVGAAGPAANFMLAVLSALVIRALVRVFGSPDDPGVMVTTLEIFIVFNCFLGLFNLLPLPPFDGSRILRGLLPWPAARVLDRIEPYGILIFALFFVILPQIAPSLHLFDRLMRPPFTWVIAQMEAVAGIPFADFFGQ